MASTKFPSQKGKLVNVHPLVVRITHWINAFAIVCMVMSGWTIYNASPLLPFSFPPALTLGSWLGGGIAWHLAMMWLLVGNGVLYLSYGFASGHFSRSLFPLNARQVRADFYAAMHFNLSHKPCVYNAVQKLLYLIVLLLCILAFLSGLAMWKPVQLQWLAAALGSYPSLRWLHFLSMAGIVVFLIIHVTLVIFVPRTLVGMVTGRVRIETSSNIP